jgi:hypothetical protein
MIRVGAFTKVFDPSRGRDRRCYNNDHCFVREDNGLWHLFGITHEEPANPLDERFLAHATAPDLFGPWTAHPPLMHADPAAGETLVWAPHVIRADGLWRMFYCAGGADNAEYRIHGAVSADLWTWTRGAENPLVVDGFDARDPMVLRVGDAWLMYFTATSSPQGGHHVVKAARSEDLVSWTPLGEVYRDPATGSWGGPTESPFVVQRDGRWFLFVCTNRDYVETAVYESDTPTRWSPDSRVATFPAHAAEVVSRDGEWFVSHCGWGQGGVYLAQLEW